MSDTDIDLPDGARNSPLTLGALIAIIAIMVPIISGAVGLTTWALTSRSGAHDEVTTLDRKVCDAIAAVDKKSDFNRQALEAETSKVQDQFDANKAQRELLMAKRDVEQNALATRITTVEGDMKGVKSDVADINHKLDRLLALAEHSAK